MYKLYWHGTFSEVGSLYKEWTGIEIKSSNKEMPGIVIVVKNDNGKIVGAAHLDIVKSAVWGFKKGVIEDVFVSQPFRGQGIGRDIVNTLINKARQLGCKFVMLTSNPDRKEANHIYETMGFRKSNAYILEL